MAGKDGSLTIIAGNGIASGAMNKIASSALTDIALRMAGIASTETKDISTRTGFVSSKTCVVSTKAEVASSHTNGISQVPIQNRRNTILCQPFRW
jgi:hypothetical protein